MRYDRISDLAGRLSERDRQVLELIADGHSTRGVAGALDTSFEDAAAVETRLMEKIGAHSRADAVRIALSEFREN